MCNLAKELACTFMSSSSLFFSYFSSVPIFTNLIKDVYKRQKQGFKQLKELFKTNKPLRILLVSMLMLEVTYALRNGFSIYYIKYNFNAEVYIPIVTGISMVSRCV